MEESAFILRVTLLGWQETWIGTVTGMHFAMRYLLTTAYLLCSIHIPPAVKVKPCAIILEDSL